MASELDQETLDAEIRSLSTNGVYDWLMVRVPDTLRVHVSFTPAGTEDLFCLRLHWSESLSSGPPSVCFCDPETKEEGRLSDWPAGLNEFFKHPGPGAAGWICNPWTKEGLDHHPEWRGRWVPNRFIWRPTTAIVDIMNRPGSYRGRAH